MKQNKNLSLISKRKANVTLSLRN